MQAGHTMPRLFVLLEFELGAANVADDPADAALCDVERRQPGNLAQEMAIGAG